MLSNLILTTPGRYNSQFKEEETEEQRDYPICLKSHT